MQLRDRMEVLIEQMLDGQILLNEAISEFEKLYILKALGRNQDHISQTAETLGIHRNTLSKRIADYQPKAQPTKSLLSKRNS